MSSKVLHKYLPRNCRLGVLDAGFGGAQPKAGVETAPLAMVQAGLHDMVLSQIGRISLPQSRCPDYAFFKPLEDPPHRGMKNPRWVSAATRYISEQVYQEARQQRQVLTLGGDHSIAIGTLTGSRRATSERFGANQGLGVIYIDAHADLNVPEDSASGNIHGMAVAFASGLAKSRERGIFDWITEKSNGNGNSTVKGTALDVDADPHTISLDKFVYIGLRDVDESEKRTIEKQRIRAFWMTDVRKLGIEEVLRQCLEHLGDDVPIHVSFDIDGLDPAFAPSTGLPVPGGLSLGEAVFIMKGINETGRLVAMDLVELNPEIGSSKDVQRTLESAFAVIEAGLGVKKG